MEKFNGVEFNRFGAEAVSNPTSALLAGYETGNSAVKEAAFRAFINGEKPVGGIAREVISDLCDRDPWMAAEFTFNLMAETLDYQSEIHDLYPVDFWDFAATSIPAKSPPATLELAKALCAVEDERKAHNDEYTFSVAAKSALRNNCQPEVVQLFVGRAIQGIRSDDSRENGWHDIAKKAGHESAWRGEKQLLLRTLDVVKLSPYAKTAKDQMYMTTVFKRLLQELEDSDIEHYAAELVDTFQALGQGSQARVEEKLTERLEAVFDVQVDAATLEQIKRTCLDMRYKYSQPDSEYDKLSLPAESQLFWPGDLVNMIDTSGYVDWRDNRPVDIANPQIIKGLDGSVYKQPEQEDEKQYRLEEVWNDDNQHSTEAKNIELVDRGELWKFAHGEITEFSDPRLATEYATMTQGFQYVSKRNLSPRSEDTYWRNEFQEWTKKSALRAIELGYADCFRFGSSLFGGRDIVIMKLNDPKIAQLVADTTLKGFGRKPRKLRTGVDIE